jgi:hypothetical protein
MIPLLTTAHVYYAAGLCPLPRVLGHVEPSYVDENGEIRSVPWGEYKTQRPDWPAVAEWFARSDLATVGMLLLTGSSPGKNCPLLHILDIESTDIFDAYHETLTYSGHADIWHRLVVEHTSGFCAPPLATSLS